MPPQPHILMCPPDYYGIEYEINPWMNCERQANHELAVAQWNDLKEILDECGVEVSLMAPVKGLPDLVFTANAAVVYRDLAILSRFRHAQRQGEEDYNEEWFRSQGWTVQFPAGECFFEGAGDALFCGDTLFTGYRQRSDVGGLQEIGGVIDCRVIPVELIDPRYYHLDTCFCPLAPGVAIYYPGAFDTYGRTAIDELVNELIEVDENEARQFSCNAVVVERTVITNVGCPQLHRQLKQRGFDPIETPLGEFVKAGGSAKCLTLRLDGEEAAAWKYA